MKIPKFLNTFLAILISFNLFFSSLYPFLISVTVYAQEDDGGGGGEAPAPEAPQAPVEQAPQPTSAPQNNFDPYVEDAPLAEVEVPEVLQEEAPAAVEPESGQILEPQPETPSEIPDLAIIADENSQNQAVEQYIANANQEQEQNQTLLQEQRDVENNPIQDFFQAISNIPQALSENWNNFTQPNQTPPQEQIQHQVVDDKVASQFDEATNQNNQQEEANKKEVDQALFASNEEKAQNLAVASNLPPQTPADEVVNTFKKDAEVAGIQVEGDLNNFEVKVPGFVDSGIEISSQQLDQLKQEQEWLKKLGDLAEGGKGLALSTVTFGLYDWNKFVTDTTEEIQGNLEKLDNLDQQRQVDKRVTGFLSREDYLFLGQKSDEQIGEIANQLVSKYGFDATQVVTQLTAERDFRNLSKEIHDKQQEVVLEANANAAMLMVGFIPGAGPEARAAGRPLLTELRELLPRAKGEVKEKGAVFVGHLQEGAGNLKSLAEGGLDNLRSIFGGSREISNLPPDQLTRVQELAFQSFGRVDEDTLKVVSGWVEKGVQSDEASSALAQTEKLQGIIDNLEELSNRQYEALLEFWNGKVPPPHELIDQVHSILQSEDITLLDLAMNNLAQEKGTGYPGGAVGLYLELRNSPEVIMDALIEYQRKVNTITSLRADQEKAFGALENYVRTHYDSNFRVENLDKVLDPNFAYVVDQKHLGDYAVGTFHPTGIHLSADYSHAMSEIYCHECSHALQYEGNLKGEMRDLLHQLAGSNIDGEEAERRITEGVTEYTKQVARSLAGLKDDNQTYDEEVRMVRNIVMTIAQNSMDRGIPSQLAIDQARALVLKTGTDGNYDRMIEAAGGVEKVRDIANSVKITTRYSDVSTQPALNEVVAARTQATEIVNQRVIPVQASTHGIEPVTQQTFLQPPVPVHEPSNPIEAVLNTVNDGATTVRENTVNAVNNVRNFFGGLFGGGQTKGVSTVSSLAVDANAFENLARKEVVKNQLKDKGKVNSTYVREAVQADILEPIFREVKDGYAVITGKEGFSAGDIPDGKYILKIGGIKGVDIKIPDVVSVKGGHLLIPVGVTQGDGKVQKVAQSVILSDRRESKDLVSEILAQESTSSARVTLTVFSDSNANGKLDKNEQILPWAGVSAYLEKAEKERIISLLSGWNLITLPNLPTKPLSAQGLLRQIAQDGGYATTVSYLENGLWVSYVVRGDKTFSVNDFAIEPGKAYFVKALKRSAVILKGQNFNQPVPLKLSPGWNGLGFPKTLKNYTVSEVFDKAQADTASRWESGLWDSFVKQNGLQYGENFKIQNNRGYIMKVEKGGVYVF